MDARFWHQKWEANDTPFNQSEANPLLVAHFEKLGVPKGARVFVPLCGKSLDMVWLRSNGYRVAGAELSKIAVEQFFADLGEHLKVSVRGKVEQYSSQDIDIFVGDIFDVTHEMLGDVDAIYDRAALVALPEKIRERYTAHLMEITDTAPQLLICFEYDQRLMEGPPFSISSEEVHKHYDERYKVTLISKTNVAGGLKGKCDAVESVWLLKND